WSSDVCSSDLDVGNGYNINHDGTIQFPMVGPVKVAGLTENEVRDRLTRLLSEYVRNPQVTVRMQAYRHQRIYVDGEVNQPGLQTMDDIPMTLPGYQPRGRLHRRCRPLLHRSDPKEPVHRDQLAGADAQGCEPRQDLVGQRRSGARAQSR